MIEKWVCNVLQHYCDAKLMLPACLRSGGVLCFTFSLLLWNDGWRVGEGLADLAVSSGVGC